MSRFKITEYGNEQIMLVRTKETGLSGLLPAEWSQCIMMEKDELDYLMIVLEEYRAKQR